MVHIYHNFFIHSSVNGHLGCFYVLAIVNSAAMNNGIHVSLSILVSSGYSWRRKWQPTPVFLPGESQGERSLVGCRLWDRTELDTTDLAAAVAAVAKDN